MAIDTTAERFDADVLAASQGKPVLVDFWAPWCAPCRVVGPVLAELEQELGTFTLVKANVQDFPDLGQRFDVSGIPAMKLFVHGQVVGELTGAVPKGQLQRWLADHLPGDEVGHLGAARAALERGNVTEAAEHFTRAFAARSDLKGPVAALGRVVIDAAGDPDAEGVDGRYVRALRAALGTTPEAGLAELLALVRTNRKYRDDAARKRLLDLFELWSDRPELVDQGRRQLAMALF